MNKSRGILPSKSYWGCAPGCGRNFHNWVDYNGVTLLVELLEWSRTRSRFLR